MKILKTSGVVMGGIALALSILNIIPENTFLHVMVVSIFIIVTNNKEETQ